MQRGCREVICGAPKALQGYCIAYDTDLPSLRLRFQSASQMFLLEVLTRDKICSYFDEPGRIFKVTV